MNWPLEVPLSILEMGLILDILIYRIWWGDVSKNALKGLGVTAPLIMGSCWYHRPDFKTQRSKPASPHCWADEEEDDTVTTDVQTWEEMSYADGVLASGFSSKINTPVSWDDLPSEMEKLMGGWYGMAKFRVSCIFRSRWGSERLPRSLLWDFPFLRKLLPSPRWECGPSTLQAFRLHLIHCFMIQFCQLFSCSPFPVERSSSQQSKSQGLARLEKALGSNMCALIFFYYS